LGVYSGAGIRTDTIRITLEILAVIAEIDEFKGARLALGTIAPERLSALRRVATIESIGPRPGPRAASSLTARSRGCSQSRALQKPVDIRQHVGRKSALPDLIEVPQGRPDDRADDQPAQRGGG
jgi:hypothetical protein